MPNPRHRALVLPTRHWRAERRSTPLVHELPLGRIAHGKDGLYGLPLPPAFHGRQVRPKHHRRHLATLRRETMNRETRLLKAKLMEDAEAVKHHGFNRFSHRRGNSTVGT
jgi:hypothetical protein